MEQTSKNRNRSRIGKALGTAAAAVLCLTAFGQLNLAYAEPHGGGGFHGGGDFTPHSARFMEVDSTRAGSMTVGSSAEVGGVATIRTMAATTTTPNRHIPKPGITAPILRATTPT